MPYIFYERARELMLDGLLWQSQRSSAGCPRAQISASLNCSRKEENDRNKWLTEKDIVGRRTMVEIYYDAYQEGLWFRDLAPKLAEAELKKFDERVPRAIEELLVYDRPDIILAVGSEPVLVLEKTEGVPTGHNVGQRFRARGPNSSFGILKYAFPNTLKLGDQVFVV